MRSRCEGSLESGASGWYATPSTWTFRQTGACGTGDSLRKLANICGLFFLTTARRTIRRSSTGISEKGEPMIGISYDKETHGVLLRLRGGRYETSEEIRPGLVIDFDSEGEPIAIEFEDVRGFMNEANLEKIVRPRIRKGADLRTFRERIGRTQEALADALQLPRNTIARWERDEMAIEKRRLLELALAALASSSSGPSLATSARTKKDR